MMILELKVSSRHKNRYHVSRISHDNICDIHIVSTLFAVLLWLTINRFSTFTQATSIACKLGKKSVFKG